MFTGLTVCHKSLLCTGLYNGRVSSVCSQLISQSPRGSAFSESATVYYMFIYSLYVLLFFCYFYLQTQSELLDKSAHCNSFAFDKYVE